MYINARYKANKNNIHIMVDDWLTLAIKINYITQAVPALV